jgi:nuclear transport factor 2 (NTF2) superfamily protein
MSGRNPQTIEEAHAFVAHIQSLFMPWNTEALLAVFTDDCVVRFGDMLEFRGKAALEKLLRDRSECQKDYRQRTQLRGFADDTITINWEGEWEDGASGKKVSGLGIETWTMRGGRIAVCEAAYDIGGSGKPSAMGLS